MPDLPYRPLVLSAIGLAGGVVAEAAHSPVIAGGGMLVGCAAIVTALGTSFLPQLNLMVSQWRFKERLAEAEAEGAKRQEELTRMGRELDKANAEIARLSRLVEEVQAVRERADSAHDAADRALRGLRSIQASGLFSPDFGPEDFPPVPVRPGKPTLLIVGREEEVRALCEVMWARAWDVTTAGTAESAIAELATPRDMTVLDLTAFPAGVGLDLLGVLRKRDPAGKVLVVRGDMEPGDEAELAALRPDRVVTRPIALEDMADYATGWGARS